MWRTETVAGRPAWRHEPSGVVFRLAPAGSFRMGLSEGELDALREIERRGEFEELPGVPPEMVTQSRPVREVRVAPFLIARHPLTVAQARHWLPGFEDDFADTDVAVARLEDDLDELLAAMSPFRLPSEAEWEYAARAGATTLTFRGDHRPDVDQLIDEFGDESRTAAAENGFGLAGMGSAAELCADVWRDDYTGAPADASPRGGDGPPAVRGGAADIYPWQGCDEWLSLCSAAREPQAGFVAVRPVAAVPTAG